MIIKTFGTFFIDIESEFGMEQIKIYTRSLRVLSNAFIGSFF